MNAAETRSTGIGGGTANSPNSFLIDEVRTGQNKPTTEARASAPSATAKAAPSQHDVDPLQQGTPGIPASFVPDVNLSPARTGSRTDERSATAAVTANLSAEDSFAALDAEARGGSRAPLHGGALHAESGFEDPALGWIRIRAELSGSGIHASLVPDSIEAARVLGTHMAGLNGYLTEHHVPVESLTMAAAANNSPDQSAGQQSFGQANYQDTDQNTNSGSPRGRPTSAKTEPGSPDSPSSSTSGGISEAAPLAQIWTMGESRTRISVMA